MAALDPGLEALATSLANARVAGTAIPAPATVPTLEQAYAIAAHAVTLMDSPRIGYKVGSTSAEAQARLGTDEPGAGAILKRFSFDDGDQIPVSPAHDLQVEVEFALRVGHTLTARSAPRTVADVRAAVDAVIPAMELVGSRFTQGLAGAGRALVTADGGANIALVLGAPVQFDHSMNLQTAPCTLRINDREAARGNGARALGDPLNVLAWLVNHLAGSGRALEAGEVVSTGTCTGLVAVAPGDRLEADFGVLGSVTCSLIER